MIDDNEENSQENTSHRGGDSLDRDTPFAILINDIPVARASANQWIDACAALTAELSRACGGTGRAPTVSARRLDRAAMNRLPAFRLAPLA